MARKPWSDKEKEILVKMCAAGKSKTEIMLVLKGRTRAAIQGKIEDLEIVIQHRDDVDMNAFNLIMGAPLGEV